MNAHCYSLVEFTVVSSLLEGLEQEVLETNCRKFQSTLVLRVCGLDEYLLEQKPISQYKVTNRIKYVYGT